MSLRFTDKQIEALRVKFGAFHSVDPVAPTYKAMEKYILQLPRSMKEQLRAANIPWVRIILGGEEFRKGRGE